MAREERLYRIAGYLKAGRNLAPQVLLREFSASPATIKRDIAHLRDQMNLPVVFDREHWCYRLDAAPPQGASAPAGAEPQLSAGEIHALLTMQQLLERLAPDGLLAPHIGSLRMRLMQWLGKGNHRAAELTRRIRVQPVACAAPPTHFQVVANALLERRRLRIEDRRDSTHDDAHGVAREVSPQRLVHGADGWQLDAWCHADGVVKRIAVDTIADAELLDAVALDLSDSQIDAALARTARDTFAVEHPAPLASH